MAQTTPIEFVRRPVVPPVPRVLVVTEPAELARIHDVDVNVVLYRRALNPAWAAEAANIIRRPPADERRVLTVADGLERAVGAWLAATAGGTALAQDVAFACDIIADLTGAVELGVRVHGLTEPMCPRFHVDRVLLRLVVTYAGAGTELLPHADVDRRFLGAAGTAAGGDAVSGLLRPGAGVIHAAPGDIVLMKGEAWPGNEGRGAVHRSPPDTRRDAPRLLVAVDPLN